MALTCARLRRAELRPAHAVRHRDPAQAGAASVALDASRVGRDNERTSLVILAFLLVIRARRRRWSPPRSRSSASTAGRARWTTSSPSVRAEPALLERRDDDTGLWNSRHFVEALTREIERSRTYGRPVALALRASSRRPRDEGEHREALRELGAAIGGSVRALDVACRVGTHRVRRDHAARPTPNGIGRRRAGAARHRPGRAPGRPPAAGRGRHRRLPGPCRDVRGAGRAGRVGAAQRPPRRPRASRTKPGTVTVVDGRLGRRRRRRLRRCASEAGGSLDVDGARHHRWHGPAQFGTALGPVCARPTSGARTLLIDPLVLDATTGRGPVDGVVAGPVDSA